MSAMNVVVVNESTLLDEKAAWNIAWCIGYQAKWHFAPHWGIDSWVSYAPKGLTPPVGATVMQLLDTADQPGALGYHDENGEEVPHIKVFVGTAKTAGDDPCAVAAHELLETLVDPHVNLSAFTGDGKRAIAYEVGDPVQGNDYELVPGFKVCDFVLPNYFDPNTAADAPTSYKGSIKGPFTIAPQGYQSYLDLANVAAGWQNGFGSERTAAPAWASRLPQRVL